MRQAFLLLVVLICFMRSALAQTSYDTAPKAQTGEQVYGSYFKTDIDTIGLYNGNLTVRIGLVDLPGRELSMGIGYTYNSQKWEQQTCDDGQNTWTCGLYTGGWRLQTPFGSYPSFFWSSCDLNAYWIDPLGTKHRYLLKNVDWATHCMTLNTDGLTLPTTDSDGSTLFAINYRDHAHS